MSSTRRLFTLLLTEWRIEGRQQKGIAAGSVFVLSTSFANHLALQALQGTTQLSAPIWGLIFWILFLCMSLYVGTTVGTMQPGRVLFYFLLASALQLWISRALHLFVLLLLLGGLSTLLQVLWISTPPLVWGRFALVLCLSAAGTAVLFTTVSLMVARTHAPAFLFVVLALPLLVPLLVFSLRATQSCLHLSSNSGDLYALSAFVSLLIGLSLVVFPYVWKK